MNSTSVAPTWFEALRGYICRILHSYVCWIPCLQRQHQVHPLSTNAGRNKFLQLSSHRRIRIVHIDSKKLSNSDSLCRKPLSVGQNERDTLNSGSKNHSLVSNTYESSEDDYWFTRWTRPLRISNNCNCSFKKKRTSLRDSGLFKIPQVNDNVNCDIDVLSKPGYNLQISPPNHINPLLPSNSSSVRAFAINFVQTILDDAVTHVSLSRPNEMCEFTSNNTCEDHPDHISDVFTVTNNSCALNDDGAQMNSVSTTTQADDGESGLGLDAGDCSDSNTNTGCVNLSFLCSPTDASAHNVKAKSCNHTKRTTRKPLLYFLHGVGSSADIWWGLLRFFVSAGYEVLAPDMLGHGYSAAPDKPSAYTFQHLLKDAIDVFDRFVGEHGKCVVIGHAYGCSLAAAVARHRTQVSHLVLISGGGPTPLAPSQRSLLFPGLRGCVEAFLVCGFKRDVLYAPCGKQMTSCAPSCDVPEYVLRYMARGQDWPEGDSTFHRRILVPTLLVHGMRDPHVTLVQECEMERTIPRSFLELIPNAGHLAMLETPAQLSHMINCFIEWWSR